GRRDSIHVLDMKAHASGDHVQRLHGAGDVGLQQHGTSIGDVGLLVDGLPDAMAEEFQRRLDAALAQVADVAAIEVGDGGAGLEHRLAGLARSDHHAPDLALLAGGLAYHRSAGNVGAILLHVAENLDAHNVAFFDRLVGRRAVGDAATNAGADLAFQAVAAAFQHHIADDLRHRLLGHARAHLPQDLADDQIGQLPDLLQHGNLFVGLDHAGVEIELAA